MFHLFNVQAQNGRVLTLFGGIRQDWPLQLQEVQGEHSAGHASNGRRFQGTPLVFVNSPWS